MQSSCLFLHWHYRLDSVIHTQMCLPTWEALGEAKIIIKGQQKHRIFGRSASVLNRNQGNRPSQMALNTSVGQSKQSFYTRLLSTVGCTTPHRFIFRWVHGVECQAPTTVSGLKRATKSILQSTPTPCHLSSSPDSTDRTSIDGQAQYTAHPTDTWTQIPN